MTVLIVATVFVVLLLVGIIAMGMAMGGSFLRSLDEGRDERRREQLGAVDRLKTTRYDRW